MLAPDGEGDLSGAEAQLRKQRPKGREDTRGAPLELEVKEAGALREVDLLGELIW
jgi:hypothetical protein